ncbi:RNA polymerase-associated protein RapA [Emticicia aquatica]|uniref:RNA polymerase-associated protein RapA n=2 Tax=Emticicia aquatica TaxID=1681835 RepID=A0ABN8EU26_9BACT|nr:RNA polymerase-associated protein RapA [Emticicia aquatica]
MSQIRLVSPKFPSGRASYFVNMKVSTLQPFQIVYSLFEHEYLGFLFEAYVVQLNSKGELTLQNQSVSSKNIFEFAERIDADDYTLVKLTEAIQQDAVVKKFSTKKLAPLDFFLKIFDPEKGDKLLQETIHGYMEKHRAEILEKLLLKQIYIMSNDGDPTWKAIKNIQEGAKAYFNFIRNEENTHYFPSIKCGGERVQFQFKNARILCEEPAWLLIDDKLYHFEKQVDGKKLKPFLNKNHIIIPRNIEETYYQKFIAPLVAQFDVFAQGFEIRFEKHEPKPLLAISEIIAAKKASVTLFEQNEDDEEENDGESKIVFDLSFQYGNYTFRFDSFSAEAYVSVERQGDSWLFHKVKRDLKYEKTQVNLLKDLGLDVRQGRSLVPKRPAFSWLQLNAKTLSENNFEVKQVENSQTQKQYFLGYSSIEVHIEEKNDWFDIKAKVRFGDFEIPFLRLRSLIMANKREFTLPNGQIAVIPEEWFTRYSELFSYVDKLDEDVTILKKHHLVLVQDLTDEGLAFSVITRKLERLRNFEKIDQYDIPKALNANLRPYQKAGYDWLRFLAEYKLGGCLADDMGLGKTIQTLAFLQSQKELGLAEHPTLLVMPTSLIYNWLKEIEKFTPSLKAFIYTGTNREKNTEQFGNYDLILTSYGILRIDIDFIKDYRFNYVILDESQSIKNPSSHISKAVMQLNSASRLILTGTPLENSTMDLWTQMTFINPGLLGTQSYFKNEYQIPIEKHQDEKQNKRLYSLIKPFMLRRHKSQVATELPPKVESIHYCDMTEEQEKCYEEAKSYYRNIILEQIEEKGFGKSQMAVLQGLTKLRQLANHPLMIDHEYEGDSGKNEEVLQKLETVVEEGHKVLVFSQFVKHLDIFRHYLDKNNMPYCYLDGSTSNRQEQVDIFQNDASIKIFLISLKAGGLGLNLTAAEYVFLLDPWWNPAIEAQAIDRAHRIGQQNTVFTYKFITRNSVEEKILTLQRNKRKLFDNLITTEENFVKSLSKEDILSLLE